MPDPRPTDNRLRGAAWHRVHVWHRRFMATYYELRDVWLIAAEEAAYGYATELEEFQRQRPRPTFKQYLLDTKGQAR